MTNTTIDKFDVVIVGAGAAGVGMGVVLQHLDVPDFIILEKHEVGASFRRWPKEMRFISPSFTSNGFGYMDLNAIALQTSPAFSLQEEHPSGPAYAAYLEGVADHFELPIQTGVTVEQIRPLPDGSFEIETDNGRLHSQFVIWAGGEYQYPHHTPFPGADLCRHSATVPRWKTVKGDEFVVIGGHESGIDAAINLSRRGKSVTVLDPDAPWEVASPDPSISLSPFTHRRLAKEMKKGRIRLEETAVSQVNQNGSGYLVQGSEGETWKTAVPPLLATGFRTSLTLVKELFEWHPDGYPLLTEEADESTRQPGFFLIGPQVRHENIIFCFIYKFRQRFAVVGEAIATRLGLPTDILDLYRQQQMFLDDLSCCDDTCAC